MNTQELKKVQGYAFAFIPLLNWLMAVHYTQPLQPPVLKNVISQIIHTPENPVLVGALISGILLAAAFSLIISKFRTAYFAGAPFRRFLRGTKMVRVATLKLKTREPKNPQITIATIPIPTHIENLHMLVAGSTGTGKSVLIREMVYRALLRGDRLILADPNGDLFSKFAKPGDVILNPYDNRTQGWSFFNEVRQDYDYKRLALSIVPRGKNNEEEVWCSFARLLLSETARKLALLGKPSIESLFHWTTIASPEELKAFLAGTAAESLFVGAEKALASARFVLSDKLPEHLTMPNGDFSLRDWLANPKGGNLYLTWREDMAASLKPLISAWVDVLCSSILSLPEDGLRRIWLFIDELASLEKLASLDAALTKGRKHGLRVVAGLQSTAQLDEVYGRDEAQILRSCFRSLVVLGGAKTDPKTAEDMSYSLGEHEVERDNQSESKGTKNTSTTHSIARIKERVVLPSEIMGLPDLSGYLALAGDYPITKFKLGILRFVSHTPAFEERGIGC